MPELRHLRAFVAVAEELNFTRAAERLHLAQQAMSKTVAQLEGELGIDLVERTSHDVALTSAGEALLEDARTVLAEADAAFARARAVGGGLAGTVRIGVTPPVGYAARDAVAVALRGDAPDLSVAFHEVRPGNLVSLLRDRTVDVVVARTSRDSAEIDSAALAPTPASLFVPAGHRLATTSPVSMAELDGERLLTWSAVGTPYTDLLMARLAAAGATLEPVEAAVTGGGGPPDLRGSGAIALLPAGWPTGEDVVELLFDEQVTLPLVLHWLAGTRSTVVERIRSAMEPGR